MDADETLDPAGEAGREKRSLDVCGAVNGVMHVLSMGCQWPNLPKDLPPRSERLLQPLGLGRHAGAHASHAPCGVPRASGARGQPTAAIIDNQSVKEADKGGARLTRQVTTAACC